MRGVRSLTRATVSCRDRGSGTIVGSPPALAQRYLDRGRAMASAPAIATAQTGTIVIRNGRIVSLFEWDWRSKGSNTMTVPARRATKAAPINTRGRQVTRRSVVHAGTD